MKAYDISGPIIVVAGLIGLSAGLVLNQGLLDIDSIVLDQSRADKTVPIVLEKLDRPMIMHHFTS